MLNFETLYPPAENFSKIKNVHVIPLALDYEKFGRAVSETLDIYPHATGRLVDEGGQWNVSKP